MSEIEVKAFPDAPVGGEVQGPRVVYQLLVDVARIVVATACTNILMEGWIEVSEANYDAAVGNTGRAKWEADTLVPYDPPAPPLAVEDYRRAIQALLDATAQERQYDGIQTAITYRDDPNPQFAADGEALFAWRSAVWTYSTAELAKVTGGQREQPNIAEFIGELPVFVWPLASS